MPGPGAVPALYRLYAWLTGAAAPLAFGVAARKLRMAGVEEARIAERKGVASLPRPGAPVIWFHGASVGESLSVLSLIRRMGERLPGVEFLLTSGTASSAALVARRLPPRTRHQFAPLDTPGAVERFLAHWRPCAGIFVESELWPNMLVRARAAGCRLALLNARLSAKSVEGWSKWPETARFVLDQFDVMLTQNAESAENLRAMGADPGRLRRGVNLKATAAPPPVDDALLAEMRARLGKRPVWVAASTHPGEEETVLAAHRQLLADHPDALLILVPRHPERGDAVAGLIEAAELASARRSCGGLPRAEAQVYLADTLGETGTWYALAPIVFLGGSLLALGGHNPYEPAARGAAVLTGPKVTNFSETFAPLRAAGGAVEVRDAASLAGAVAAWLEDPQALEGARCAARRFAERGAAALEEMVETLVRALELRGA